MVEYKNKVVFLYKSKEGKHLYAFNNDNVLGNNVDSILMNIAEVKEVIEGTVRFAKVSIMETKKEEGQASLPTKPEEI